MSVADRGEPSGGQISSVVSYYTEVASNGRPSEPLTKVSVALKGPPFLRSSALPFLRAVSPNDIASRPVPAIALEGRDGAARDVRSLSIDTSRRDACGEREKDKGEKHDIARSITSAVDYLPHSLLAITVPRYR